MTSTTLKFGVIHLLLVAVVLAGESHAMYWKTAAIHPVDSTGRHVVRVCWDPGSTAAFPAEKALVQATVEQTWSFFGNVDFWDWGACQFGKSGMIGSILNTVVIVESNWHSYTPGLGTEMYGPMRLNFSFNNPDPDWAFMNSSCSGANQARCVASTALHEFGHALGFAHEFDRPDSGAYDPLESYIARVDSPPCIRDWWNSGANATTPFFDVQSVMNYPGGCGGRQMPLSLTDEDIGGLMQVYGIGGRYAASIIATQM